MQNQNYEINLLRHDISITNKNRQVIYNIIMVIGSLGFTLMGTASYLNETLLCLFDGTKVIFFPQGITMTIYGVIGLILSINQIRIYILKVGEGYNEFNKNTGKATIFRKGFPGNSKDVNITFSLKDIVRN